MASCGFEAVVGDEDAAVSFGALALSHSLATVIGACPGGTWCGFAGLPLALILIPSWASHRSQVSDGWCKWDNNGWVRAIKTAAGCGSHADSWQHCLACSQGTSGEQLVSRT